MSWFPNNNNLPLITRDLPGVVCDEEVGMEISPGVIIERRYFLWLAAGAASIALPGAAQARPMRSKQSAAPEVETDLEFSSLVDNLYDEAEVLIAEENPDEDQYLSSIVDRLQRCHDIELADFYGGRSVEFANVHRQPPLVVIQIRFEEGATIPLHDHREYNGVLLGMEGEIQVRNFDYLDAEAALESTGTFKIRETQKGILTPGVASTLSRTRDNIHEAVGGEGGGVVLDVFTFFQDDAGSNYLDFNDTPIAGEEDVYEVTWY